MRLRRGRRPEAYALPHVRQQELDRRRVGLSVAARAIMSVDRAEWAMQKPSLLEWMAWRRYLIAIRAGSGGTYEVIEESAWIRLLYDLDRVGSSPCQERSSVGGRWSAGHEESDSRFEDLERARPQS